MNDEPAVPAQQADPFKELMAQKEIPSGRQLLGGEESAADWLIRKQTERDAPFKNAIQQGFDVPQNKAIRLLRTASTLGVPSDLIKDNLDEAEAQANKIGFDSQEFQKYSPVLAKWLSKDPNYVAIMKPDFSGMINLQRIFYRKNDPNRPQTEEEMVARAMQLAAFQGERAAAPQEVGGTETELGTTPIEQIRMMTPTQKAEATQRFFERNLAELRAENELLKRHEPIGGKEAIANRLSENPLAPVPIASDLIDYAMKYAPLREAAKRKEAGRATIEDIDLLERTARLEAVAQKRGTTLFGDVANIGMSLAPFAGAAALTGGLSAAAEAGVSRAAGAAGESFLQRFASYGLSKAAGAAVSTPIVGMGRIPLGAIKRSTPTGEYGRDEQGNAFYTVHAGTGEDISVGVRKEAFSTFADLLSAHAFGWWTKTQGPSATQGGLLAHILKTGGKDALQGMAMGDLAQFMKEATGTEPWDLPSMVKMLYDPKARQEGLATGIVFSSLGIAGAGPREGLSGKMRADLVASHAEALRTFDALKAHDQALLDAGETIKGMSSFKAAPEVNRKAVEAVTQDDPFQYINAHAFEAVYLQQGKDPHAEAAKLTGKPDALQEALDIGPGGEMKVPTADWLSKVSATDQAALFQGAARRDPMSPTTSEAQQHLAALDKEMEDARNAAPEIKAATDAKAKVDEEAATLGKNMAAQAEAAGRPKPEASRIGQLVESVYRIFGMRGKSTPEELAAKYGPVIQKAEAGQAQQLEQPSEAGPRGSYIPRDITKDKAVINAFQSADKSTVPHELGHHFLDMMADLASQPQAEGFASGHNQTIKDDFQTFLDWRGIKSPEEWNQMTLDQKRPHHEAWADAYEQWLWEGKAPSKSMRDMFHRFREWIGAVYDKFVGKGIVIPDQIRGVFERMHATDAEIQSAKQRLGRFEPFLENVPNVVFTPAEQAKMDELAAEGNRYATERVDAEALSDMKQEQGKQYQHAKDVIKGDVTTEFQQTKEAKALSYFTKWENPDGSKLPEGTPLFKLSSEDVAKENPGLDLKSLPKGVLDADFNEDNGISPQAAAEAFGFSSGEELVKALINTNPEAWIKTETDARAAMNLVNPVETLTDEARAAIHNDAEQKLSVYQMKWLAENKLPQRDDLIKKFTDPVRYIKELRDFAIRKMDALTYRDRDVRVYERGERDARKAARDAILKGDIAGAIAFKEKEALNHEYVRAAYEAKAEADKADRYMKRFTDKDVRGEIGKADNVTGQEGLAVIDNINRRFEFTNDTAAKQESRGILVDYIAERMKDARDNGELSKAPDWLRNEAFKMNWKDLKHSDLLDLRDTAKQIETQARQANRVTDQEKYVTMHDARAEVKERLKDLESRPPESSRTAKGLIEKALDLARSADAAMVKMEQVIREADGGDINGPFHRLFMFGAADAQAREMDLKKSVQAELAKAMAGLSKETQSRMGEIIALPGRRKITRFDTLGFAHQAGNASNWSKFLRGEAMRKGGFTKEEISKFLHDLSKEEKDLVQKMWDISDSVFSQAAQMYKRLTGLEPDKITAQPQHEALEGYRGGVAHIVYDSHESKQGERQANAQIGEFTKDGYMRSTEANGYSKSRQEGFAAPMDTDLNNFPAHMGIMIHDLTHREWSLNVNKLLGDKEISDTIKDKLGHETYRRMKEWHSVIVNDRNQSSLGSLSVFKRLVNGMRLNMAILVTGFKAGTLLHHISSIEGAIGEIGPSYMAMGAQKFFTAPFEMHKWISERSGEIRHFAETFDRDNLEIYNKTSGKTDFISMAQRAASHAIGMANLTRAEPIWLGAYFKALDTLHESHTGEARERLAIRSADEVVRLTVGGGAAKDRAAIMSPNSDFMKVFTTFFTPGSILYSRLHDVGYDMKTGDVSKAMSKVFWTAVMGSITQKLISGHGPDKDHDETWAGWIARNEALYPLSSVPILKEAAEAIITGQVPPSSNPIVRGTEQIVHGISAIKKGASGEMSAAQSAEETARAANMFVGLPIDQLFITGDYLRDLSTGDKAKPDDLFEFWKNVLHYHRKH